MFFELGLILLPFENLFFAPSAGWAAIAPISFFIYTILNLEKSISKISYKMLIIIGGIFFISFFSYIFYYIEIGNLIANLFTIVLGLTFYIALKVRYLKVKSSLVKDINLLFNTYLIALLIGVIQYISYSLNVGFIIKFFEVISKRFYYPRVQITFTEPSFISCHVFGILLLIILFCRKNNIKLRKKNYYIFYSWIILSNLMIKSARLALDTVLVLGFLFFYYKIIRNRKKVNKYLLLLMSSLLIFGVLSSKNIIKNYNYRIYQILNQGVYADGSMASRYFRINASVKGYFKNMKSIILGHGIGNMYIPFSLGYDEARSEYANNYLKEVIALKGNKMTSLFSMPIKIISELGIIVFLILGITLYSKKYADIYIIMIYIYTQFDSYAFYTVWMYIFFSKYLKKRKLKKYRRVLK